MANTTFLDLPIAVTLDGTEVVPIVQPPNATDGVSKRVTVAQIAQLANPGSTLLDPESILGNPRTTASVGTSISGNPSQVLRYTEGGQISFGQVNLSTAVAVTGILPVSNGGIGTSALDSGTVLLGNGTGSITPLANVTSGYVLTTNGTSLAPSWQVGGGLANQPPLTVLGVPGNATSTPSAIGRASANQVLRADPSGTALAFGQINLSSTSAITGTLAITAYLTGIVTVPLGGSGTSSLTANALIAGNDTSAVQVIAAGSAGQLLVAQTTTSLPAYKTIGGDITLSSAGTATIANAAVTYAKVQQVAALSVLGNSSSAAATAVAIAGTANQVLVVNTAGTGLAFGSLVSSVITGIVAVSFGGTGTSALTANGLLAGNGTSAVGIVVAGSAGQVLIAQTTTSNPSFNTISGDITLTAGGAATIANGAVTYAKFQTMAALSVHANSSSATATSVALAGTANQVLVVNAAGTALVFGQVNLTAGVTGVVPVANGGSGTSTLTAHGVLIGNGTSAVTLSAVGSNGQLLIGQTGADPTWNTMGTDATIASNGALTIANNAVTYAKFQTMTALSVHANTSSAAANSTALAGTANQVLIVNPAGTALVFGQVNMTAGVTGILPIANGGTNASVAATAIINLGGMSLTTTGQAFTGGITLTSLSLGTATGATTTLVAGNPPLQRIIINGTATFVAPSSECEIDVLVTNAASAGAISFSGYSVGSNTGDAYATTSGNKFILMSRTINGSSTYAWKALQ